MNPNLDQVGTLVKSVNGNKQLLAQMVQQGQLPHDIALLAGMRIDRLSKPQGNPGQQPTVLEKTFAPQQQMAPQGIAQLQQPQMPMPQQAPQMPMPQQPPVQAAEGGLMELPVGDMFNEASYAGGGIIAFDEGGDVPGFAAGAYLKNPVGKYFNPKDLTLYEDAEIQKQLELNPYKSIEQIRDEQAKLRGSYGIKNIAAEQRAELDKDKEENEAFRSRLGAEAGLAAAAGFLGNTSQYFGPGAKDAATNYLSTKAAGEKEYRATAKDIRNMGFEIGRADQAMRQAEMSGDQSMYNSERSRRDGLLKQSQEIKFKNVADKNALLGEGAKAAATYDTTTAAARAKAKGTGALDLAKVNAKVLNAAKELMAVQYPAGQYTTYFESNPDKYQEILSGYIKQAEDYIYKGEIAKTAPGSKVVLPKVDAGANYKNNLVTPSAATITGTKLNPKIKSILDKYPASKNISTAVDENENDD
jgi:hypothetical protein